MKAHNRPATLAGNETWNLGDQLRLTRFEFDPNIVESFGRTVFTLEFWAAEPLTIAHLSLLLYSAQNIRIAIVDLRTQNETYRVPEKGTLLIRGTIGGLNLVEGHYRVGIHLQAGGISGDFYDLSQITIVPRERSSGVIPYQPIHRGYVELAASLLEVSAAHPPSRTPSLQSHC